MFSVERRARLRRWWAWWFYSCSIHLEKDGERVKAIYELIAQGKGGRSPAMCRWCNVLITMDAIEMAALRKPPPTLR